MAHPVLRCRLTAGIVLLAGPALVLATPGAAGAVRHRASATTAPATRDRAVAAAGWLGRQLDPATHTMIGQFGPDYGLTADVVLALDASGSGKVAARQATQSLRTHVLAYTGFGNLKEHYAGASAKLLVVTAAQGDNPRAFGSGPRRNLVAGLRSLECGTATRKDCARRDRGRFADVSTFGDFSNTFGQSLAIIGLVRTTRSGPSADAVAFLRRQQCADGSFPESYHAAACTGSVDATGFAVQALTAVGGKRSAAAATTAAAAGRWLARQQHADGSFTANGSRNANSTGIAAQALTVLGRDKAATEARSFLRRLQVLCGGKAADRGKIRYDLKGGGDTPRATSQAIPALAGATLVDVSARGAVRPLATLSC